jgi:hypothetical protein
MRDMWSRAQRSGSQKKTYANDRTEIEKNYIYKMVSA